MKETFSKTEILKSDDWDLIIRSQKNWLDIKFADIWQYRDLVFLFVRRDFVAQYKQTLLGPLWHVIQPLLTTFLFTIIFGKLAHLGTDQSPPALFYLSGVIMWNLFSGCVLGTSSTFVNNVGIFGKIYFPRLVIPISVIISTIIRFGIQLALFILVLVYFLVFMKGEAGLVAPNMHILLLPWILIIVAILGLGIGILVSSLTTKYRDLTMFVNFGISLLMYLSPVIYPAIIWKQYEWVMKLNPLTYVLEGFRYSFIGTGHFSFHGLIYSTIFALLFFFVGVVFFGQVEKKFMDTV
jgi:lipopolysaccharide transport system permease protein